MLPAAALAAALLSACQSPAPSAGAPGTTASPPATEPAASTASEAPRYRPVALESIPAWTSSDLASGFAAWRKGCPRLVQRQPVWQESCKAAQSVADDADSIRRFLLQYLAAYQLESSTGERSGLITGYFEPIYPGSRSKTARAAVPVYGIPDDLISVSLDGLYPELKGKRLRGQLKGRQLLPYADSASIRKQGLGAPVLAWLENPLDLQFLQVQGSGRVRLADGSELRLGYADQNGHPYAPVGRWLIRNQEVPASEMSMQRIRQWAKANPARVGELLDSNPSYVFFRTLPASNDGPPGSLAVPLTAGYSIAVDPNAIALGSPVFLATTRPDNGAPIQRLVAAQDTGGAIRGAVRADFFWGSGDQAGELAGEMKQAGQLWLLWPKTAALPNVR
ncbi:MltA domain-containing protein [Chitinilyticum litopenaei]|uniref:peptidoglycan lytic exotransglycosylase n=2 Tax=Chitinilyticum piscinae TaxID=2866724 RepID=A0A8J7FI26_9NEIS|nr:MltA domain-containing protein [Chitinilyticum piscinae]